MPATQVNEIRALTRDLCGAAWGCGAPVGHRRPERKSVADARGFQPRIWYLLISRWKVLRSIPAAFAAADTLPPWRSSRSRK